MKRLIAALLATLLLASVASATLTLTQKDWDTWGHSRIFTCRALFDNSYLTGGESLTPADMGLSSVYYISITGDSTGCVGYSFGYDVANETVYVGGVEVTLAVDPTSFNLTLTADSPLPDSVSVACDVPSTDATIVFEQMDSATDLSAVRVRILAVGR